MYKHVGLSTGFSSQPYPICFCGLPQVGDEVRPTHQDLCEWWDPSPNSPAQHSFSGSVPQPSWAPPPLKKPKTSLAGPPGPSSLQDALLLWGPPARWWNWAVGLDRLLDGSRQFCYSKLCALWYI